MLWMLQTSLCGQPVQFSLVQRASLACLSAHCDDTSPQSQDMSHLRPSLLQLSLKLRVQLLLLMHLLLQHHGIHRGPVHVSHAHALAATARGVQAPRHRILLLQIPPLVLQTAARKHSALSQAAVSPARLQAGQQLSCRSSCAGARLGH